MKKHSKILIALTMVFTVIVTSMIFSLTIKIKENENKREILTARYADLKIKNEDLHDFYENIDNLSYIERYAREKFGYYFPNEHRYRDTTQGNY